jgi:hypothetical protein
VNREYVLLATNRICKTISLFLFIYQLYYDYLIRLARAAELGADGGVSADVEFVRSSRCTHSPEEGRCGFRVVVRKAIVVHLCDHRTPAESFYVSQSGLILVLMD